MKTSPANSPLDGFIVDALKAPDTNLPAVEWSEVEVLLRHEQKSISVGVDRKTIFIGAAVAGILLLVFGIYKIASYYSSLPPDPAEETVAPAQNSFNVIDTHKVEVKDSITPPKTTVAAIDSSLLPKIIKKIDSVAVPVSDTSFIKKLTDVQKQDKRKKRNALRDSLKADLTKPLPADTATIPPIHEVTKEVPPPVVVPDTANKTAPAPKKNSKRKKNKSPKTDSTAVIKSDSLKQQ